MDEQIDFPDADGMNPENVTVCKCLFEVGIIVAKSFLESVSPIAAARHPVKIIR